MSGPSPLASVIVTGATGFVGSRLVRALLANGTATHALVRPQSKLDQLPKINERFHIHTIDGSVSSLTAIIRAAQPTVIFHVASLVLVTHTQNDIARLIEANLTFGTMLLEAAALCGVSRIVNTGTYWEHLEDAAFRPVNLYAATKQAFEAIIGYYTDVRLMKVITLKLFDTYGPDDPRGKLMASLHAAAMNNRPLMMSPGEQILDLVYIEDVARAFIHAGELTEAMPPGNHVRYAVSGSQRVTLRELVGIMESTLHFKVPVTFGGRPYREREVMEPWTQGATLPGWTASTRLAEGIAKTFEPRL